jgi:hypothetical protein
MKLGTIFKSVDCFKSFPLSVFFNHFSLHQDYNGALGNATLAMACQGFNPDKRDRLIDRCNKCQEIIGTNVIRFV